MSNESKNRSSLGTSTPRVDGIDKVTGVALFTSDFRLPGILWGKTLRSPFPHARIVSIDTSKAAAMPGVHAVLTGQDLVGARFGRCIVDVPVLAHEVVRFVGEQVAAVAANDEDIAQQALDMIEIEYEELPSNFDEVAGMQPGAVLVHPDLLTYKGLSTPPSEPSNVFDTHSWGKGDISVGFEESELVIENTFTVPNVHQAYFEPHSCMVWIDEEGRAQVWASNKTPYDARRQVAAAVGIDEEALLFNPVQIGGDFGGKGSPMNISLCYFLATASGRPVRMVFDYIEEFMAANPRHSATMKFRTGVKSDGTLVAHEVDLIFNSGAYAGFKPLSYLPLSHAAGGPYRVAHSRVTAYLVYTNRVPCGHMRGPGGVQGIFALESQMDCVARAVGLTPLEFRLKNLIREGEENAIGEVHHEIRAIETLEAAISASQAASPNNSMGSHWRFGKGFAIGNESPGVGEANASVHLGLDGAVTVFTPVFEQGSGVYTTLRQVVSDELGLAPGRIDIQVSDTDSVPFDSGMGASRVTRIATQAAYKAVSDARDQVFGIAQNLHGWHPSNISLSGDTVVNGMTDEMIPWASLLVEHGQAIIGTGHVKDTDPSPVTSFTVQVADVAVDTETGEVKLLKVTTAHDTGYIVNPQGHQGQINGGLMQGIGYALMEELRVEDGRVTTLSFADFKIPTMADIPELETVLLSSDSGLGPYKVKAISETSISPIAPAIANAVDDAIGVRIFDLPITAEKVFRLLK